MKLLRLYVLLPLLLFVFARISDAQSFDYNKYPRLNFSFQSMNLNLDINPEEATIDGKVKYKLKANAAGFDSLRLQAGSMEIESVKIGNKNTGFKLRNDSLMIALGETAQTGAEYTVVIDYKTKPRFGLLKSSESTVWTSLLPLTKQHWVPVLDHPRITVSSSISITVPEGYRVTASGVKVEEDVLKSGKVRSMFRTDRELPITALSFAVGKFKTDDTSLGIKKINIYSEPGSITAKQRKRLLERARKLLEMTEQRAGFEYPYQRLNMVVLGDHYWEEKNYGATTVFLYLNRGNLTRQLRRGIYGQWFGVYQREEQWSEAQGILLYQTALHYKLTNNPAFLGSKNTPDSAHTDPYNAFGAETWNRLQKIYKSPQATDLKRVSRESLGDVLNNGEGVYGWSDYAREWYRAFGQPKFEIPAFELPPDTTGKDTIKYRVDYDFERDADRLNLKFTAEKGQFEDSVSLPLVIITSDTTDTSEVSFTGAQDSVVVQVPGMVENVVIDAAGKEGLVLDEFKPASFLIYELRNAKTLKERKEAALKLGYYHENPDLQFAILEFLNRDLRPEVKAALLKSFGEISGGAEGTQQRFLDALKSEALEMREAAVSALKNFSREDKKVTQALRASAMNEKDPELSQRAMRVYMQRIDSAEVVPFVNQVIKQDTAGTRAIVAIGQLARFGKEDAIANRAGYYIDPVFSYPVRAKALNLLIQYDQSSESWSKRVQMLLKDLDPRIRFLMTEGLSKVEGLNASALLKNAIRNEYDARVYRAMEGILAGSEKAKVKGENPEADGGR